MAKKLSEKVEELLAIAKARVEFKKKLYSLMEKFANDEANRDKYAEEVVTLFAKAESRKMVEVDILEDKNLPF